MGLEGRSEDNFKKKLAKTRKALNNAVEIVFSNVTKLEKVAQESPQYET
jgi:hypothetical protein